MGRQDRNRQPLIADRHKSTTTPTAGPVAAAGPSPSSAPAAVPPARAAAPISFAKPTFSAWKALSTYFAISATPSGTPTDSSPSSTTVPFTLRIMIGMWPAMTSQIVIVMLGSAVCGQIAAQDRRSVLTRAFVLSGYGGYGGARPRIAAWDS